MSKILLLDEATANQIAAGEVVERPVSVVKELVENSLDAGANRISVELVEGGGDCIKVVDNGSGMSAQDATLCFQRHATSKIKMAEDLNHILTLGFRGEAMPSVAAVARVTLVTRQQDEVAGTMVFVEAGEIKEVSPVGCPVGTSVEVRDLFYNTPARRKFLKTATAETSQISDLLSRIALARPDVRFELRSGARVLFFSPGTGSIKDTAASIFGAENVRSMLEVNYQGSLLSITGLISKPVLTRASRQYQNFFINGRYIRSGFISGLLSQSYQTLIPAGRFPMAVLHLQLDPAQVDVNVHPTKMEIRFANEKEVQGNVLEALSQTLSLPKAIPGFWEAMPNRKMTPPAEASVETNGRPAKAPGEQPKESPIAEITIDTAKVEAKAEIPVQSKEQLRFPLPLQHQSAKEAVTSTEPLFKPVAKATPQTVPNQAISEGSSPYQAAEDTVFPYLTPIGQIPPTYVLAYGEVGLYIIDQHAAHERVLYERYHKLLQQNARAQMLLQPITLEIPHHEAQLVIQHILDFQEIGFLLEHFGGDTFLLRGVPDRASDASANVFLDLLARLQEYPESRFNKGFVIEQLAVSMACRDAVKAKAHLGNPEIKALLEGLAHCQQPFTCPHGRPTLIQITQEELKKRFKR
ncbi:DNA mismatch repair endonuclease MutL [Desulforamulus aeronauticus]|uniref:DNA mismatch repair protein MutL n=1 Tax=Desulforamulus aeronauticus DSM 10349 TaxID=1121421 RepID=A0A1M6UPX0_9FIRM|nr:DNA mismatch repair endonuclease MutL [Desulforamulus aeronauticus]SHK71211.1 DNA mismatch repair protein MutL [Desulforamulus aeronauticus DSM 10349]